MTGPRIYLPGASRNDGILYDLRHLDGSDFQSTSAASSRDRFGGSFGPTAALGYFNVATVGGAPAGTDALLIDALGLYHRTTAGLGAAGQRVFSSHWWNVPLRDTSLLPAIFGLRRRFTVSALIQMQQLSANSAYFWALQGGSTLLENPAGFGLRIVYDPAVGATWRAQSRPLPGAATVQHGDSGIAVTTTVQATFVYTEDPAGTGTLEAYVNDILVASLTGAQLPGPGVVPSPALGLQAMFGGGRTVGATNDGQLATRECRYLVEIMAE